MNRTRLHLGAIALAVVALVAAPVAAPVAVAAPRPAAAAAPVDAPEVTWSIAPAGEQGADGRVSIRQTVDPGAEVRDRVAVQNHGAEPATFLIYASDGIITEAGDFDLLDAATAPEDGGAWVSLSTGSAEPALAPLRVEVPAASAVLVNVAIAVPANATPGDHPAGIVAELASEASSGVDFAARVGVRVHLRVAGEVAPAIVVGATTVHFEPSWNPFAPGRMLLRSEVRNDGNVRLGADAVATSAGILGLDATTTSLETVREILPGQQAVVVAEWEAWPLFAVAGAVNVVPVVVGDDVVPDGLVSVSEAFSVVAVPWAQLLLLVLVVVAIVLVILGIRRSRRRRREAFERAVEERARELTPAG
ncbi:hypothetical protein ACIQLJ_02300 [Microbacterium sp. NPDC091313]